MLVNGVNRKVNRKNRSTIKKGDLIFYCLLLLIPLTKAVKTAKKFDGKNVIRISFSGKNDDESARIVSPAKTCTEYSHNAGIESLNINGTKAEVLPNGNLKATAPKNAVFIKLNVKLSDENGLLYINDKLVDDSKEISIPVTTNPLLLGLKTYAEDHETAVEKSLLINMQ